MASPFTLHRNAALPVPVVLSVPHAGRAYPVAASPLLRVPLHRLMKLEDRHADLLTTDAIRAGAQAIIATVPRLWIDLNRAENDIDPHMVSGKLQLAAPVSAKARGGLGLIPRRIADVGDLWRDRLTAQDVQTRIATCHRPYHAALSALLGDVHQAHGIAILIDVHSMPPLEGGRSPDAPQIVLGDRFGRSASRPVLLAIADVLEEAGLRVAINTPYPGNYLLDRHGRPRDGIHAVQIEIDRRRYLDEWLAEPGTGLNAMRAILARGVERLAAQFGSSITAIAAE